MSTPKTISDVCAEVLRKNEERTQGIWEIDYGNVEIQIRPTGKTRKIILCYQNNNVQANHRVAEDQDDNAEYIVLAANNAPKLAKALMRAQEALLSIGSIDARAPEHDSEAYWLDRSHAVCAETIAEDTRFARKALADIEELLKCMQ